MSKKNIGGNFCIMSKVKFEWDEKKNKENIAKHGLPFEVAQYAFADPNRVIAEEIARTFN